MRTGWVFMISLTGNIPKGLSYCVKQEGHFTSDQKAAP